jgi:hypothetical protein
MKTKLLFRLANSQEYGPVVVVSATGPCGRKVGDVAYIIEPDKHALVLIPKPLGAASAARVGVIAQMTDVLLPGLEAGLPIELEVEP